jgi:hypothetical protein
MPIITVDMREWPIDEAVDQALKMAIMLTVVRDGHGSLDFETASRSIGRTDSPVLSVADDEGPTEVIFVHRGVGVKVQPDSDLSLLVRDCQRVLDLCFDGPVGPHPQDRYNERGESVISRFEAFASLRAERERTLLALRETIYLPPPAAGTVFRYRPGITARGTVHRITRRQLDYLPFGTPLRDMQGRIVRKGYDALDLDETDGFIGYGFTEHGSEYMAAYRTE